jgi:2-polyprenyl-6-methoxyphenol hydroxylase-like FAD-dependent oxidoreductase
MERPRVVIAGGGVAGLAVAIALTRRGIASVVLEKRSAPGEIDRGDVIHDSVLTILRRWGLETALGASQPMRFSTFRILNTQGDLILEVDLGADLDRTAHFTLLPHPDIERMLEERAVSTGLVDLRRQVTCVDLLREGERVVGVQTTSGAVASDLVVVAEGARSPLRDRHFPGTMARDYPTSFYNARARGLPEYADAGYYVLGEGGIMVMAPLPRGEMRLGIQYRRDDPAEAITPRNLKAIVARRLRTFPVDRLEVLDGHVYRISRSLGRTFAIPGAVLAGDAAHTVHPAGGQGMNLAFQDAEALAARLEGTGRAREPLDRAGRAYSEQRRREIRSVLRRTHVMGMLASVERASSIRARELGIRLLNHSRLAKRLVVGRIIDVR